MTYLIIILAIIALVGAIIALSQNPTVAQLRRVLAFGNLFHLGALVCLGGEIYYSLMGHASPNWDMFTVSLLAFALYSLTGYFGRWRDNALVAGQPWRPLSILWGLYLGFSFFVPFTDINPVNITSPWAQWLMGAVAFGPGAVADSDKTGFVILWIVGLWFFFTLTSRNLDRVVRIVGLYWGTRSAFGAIVLWWGLQAMQWCQVNLTGITSSLAQAGWIFATVLAICGTIGWKVWRDMANADQDFWYSALDLEGGWKAFGSGGDVSHFIGNFTGVAEATVPLPLWPGLWWVLTRNYTAIWAWQLVDLERRGDPRWFCNDLMWVGPGFCMPGIPLYTRIKVLSGSLWELVSKVPAVAKATKDAAGVQKFGTFVTIPNLKVEKNDLYADTIEVDIRFSYGLRIMMPFMMWNSTGWGEVINDVFDTLASAICTIRGFSVVGLKCPIADIGNFWPGRQATGIHPQVDALPAVPGIDVADEQAVRDVAQQTGGLITDRKLEDADCTHESDRRAISDRQKVHVLVRLMEEHGVDDAVIQQTVAHMVGLLALGWTNAQPLMLQHLGALGIAPAAARAAVGAGGAGAGGGRGGGTP